MAQKKNIGFTLIELLVVVSIIALLVSILLPALADARRQAKGAVDQNNQHQIGISLTLYSAEYEGWFPLSYSGNWLFDVSYLTTDYIIATGGDRKVMYCPLEKYKNPDDDLFWYAGEVFYIYRSVPLPKNRREPTADELKQWFRVTGYNWLLGAAPGYEAMRPEKDLRGNPRYFSNSNNRTWVKKATQRNAADTELVVCMTFSDDRNRETSLFEDIESTGALGRYGVKDTTAHLTRNGQPRGGHILFVDGHVEWRSFEDMDYRYTIRYLGGPPIHWW